MKKKLAAALAIALLAMSYAGLTAFALSPAPEGPEPDHFINEPPLPAVPSSLDVKIEACVVGKDGDRYEAGDLVVLAASVENNSTEPVSGQLSLAYPDGIGELVAAPVLETTGEHMDCDVKDLAPGGRAEIAVVIRAADEPAVTDWDAMAAFYISNGGGACAVHTEMHFGQPYLKADKSSLLHDGVIRVRNEGNGGASRIKFRFLAKDGWQKQDGLPDGMKYVGEGRIEVDLGGLVPGGKLEKDVSGLLHQRMDPKGPFEVVYEIDIDGPQEEAEWEDVTE